MSSLQGQTAKDEKHRYALCVITRPSGTLIDKEYFLQHVKFVPTIGELLGDKLSNILMILPCTNYSVNIFQISSFKEVKFLWETAEMK